MCDTEGRLDGKVVIVTGGSAGIGLGTAKNLAKLGARVVIASRNETKLKLARDEIQNASGNNDVDYRLLDLANLSSVRNFARETLTSEKRIDVLINNAGAVGLPDRLTDDGLNLTMQVNYFGTFLLTFLLLPMLKASAPSRILNSSAASMYIGHLDFDHWNDIGRYNAITAVGTSKLAETLFTAELDRKLKGTRVTANSFDPFLVRDTEVFNNAPEPFRGAVKLFYNIVGLSKEEIGQQIAYLAAEPTLEDESGQNYKFCRKWWNHWSVSDADLTGRLWEASKKAVKISEEEDWETSESE